MEKILIKNDVDRAKATLFFGKKYEKTILESINNYPVILIGDYSEDIEFGSGYNFTTIYLDDFNKKSGEKFY